MSTAIGLLAAGASVIGWGSYFVPMKKVGKYDPFYFQLLMCFAIFVSSFLISIFNQSFFISIFGIVAGLLWSSGNILSAQAVRSSGLSKTAPLWMGTGIFISALWGILFFREKLTILMLGLLGIFILILGIWLVSSITDNKEGASSNGKMLAI